MKNQLNNDNFSVLIPDGESVYTILVLRCLGQLKNINIYVLANQSFASSRFSRYTTQFFSYSKLSGDKGRINEINKIIRKKKIDIILPVDEALIHLLSKQREKLEKDIPIAPIPNTEVFEIAQNKWLFAEWLKKEQLPTPPTILFQNNARFSASLSLLTFPVLLKPVYGGGGIGIRLFENAAELNDFCKDFNGREKHIVQSFIDGYDIGCNVLCKDGKILSHTIQKGFISASLPFCSSSNLDFYEDENVLLFVSKVIAKLKWTGIVNFDLRYDEKENQLMVIEMNPRYWASLLGSLATGINFPYLACILGLNRELPIVKAKPIRFVQAKVAFKIMIKRIFNTKHAGEYFDHSTIDFFKKDPFPKAMEGFLKIYNHIFVRDN
ncbi:MAG: ATP-grasp domain-containing protein [Bacteroidales bacterium]